MMNTINEIPTLAADYLDKYGWTQGDMFDGQTGAACLHAAIRECTPQKGDAEIVRAIARRQGYSEHWNDNPNRTEAEVLAALAHIDTSDMALEKTFGPQWEAIVALVRRTAVLTPEESEALRDAWYAAMDAAVEAAGASAWTAAGSTARNSALSAARDAAWYAAGYAAWNTARDVARAAARAAAHALVTRDLIGPHVFTQDHYDTLTGPWATVIGPAHPNDKETRA